MFHIFMFIAVLVFFNYAKKLDIPQSEKKPTVSVYASTDAIVCEFSGISIRDSAIALRQADIDVLASRCGVKTNAIYNRVCGAATGAINIHEIYRDQLPQAKQLDFEEVSELTTENGANQYLLVDCRNKV